MKNRIIFFLVCMFMASYASACSCISQTYFCDAVNEDTNVVRAKVIDKYELEGNDEELPKFYIDVVIVENILGDFAGDTVSIVSSITSCDLYLLNVFDIGDEMILNRVDENTIDDFSGHPYITPGFCTVHILFFNDDGTVQGGIQSDLSTQTYEAFKEEIGTCSELTALDRWLKELDDNIYLWPNPSSDEIFIETTFSLDEVGAYGLYDTAGQLVQQGSFNLKNFLRIGIQKLPRGVYFLKITIRDKSVIRKIVKN